jgi:3-oxoadipate enol-lactonase/4-carboxymuconolactone decarboxylase
MPFTTRDNVRLYWKLEGAEDRPALLLLNSIGTDLSLWDATLPALRMPFRLLRMDMRGHGASDAPPGDYSLPMLAADAAAILDEAGLAQVAVAGVSLGGMVAMQLALDHPKCISALALICTSAQMDVAAWETRIATVRREGTAAIAEMAVGRFLSPAYAARHPEIADGLKRGIAAQAAAGYAGAAAAIRDMVLAERLGEIGIPALVVTGETDISTPFAGHGDRLLRALPDARHVPLVSAHLPPIEAPGALAAALAQFLLPREKEATAAQTLYEAGLRNRRRVLGDAWVDQSLSGRTEFNTDFQAMITRIAWHEIWGRPGLDDRTRRLLVLAITASLGRWEEFVLHVRAGLKQGGFTKDELKETLLQIAIYAGVPAANTAFAKAESIISTVA